MISPKLVYIDEYGLYRYNFNNMLKILIQYGKIMFGMRIKLIHLIHNLIKFAANSFNMNVMPSKIAFMQLYLYIFTGEIPSEIGNLHSLEMIVVPNMSLVGPIPASIFNISSLNEIYLQNNSLSGNLV